LRHTPKPNKNMATAKKNLEIDLDKIVLVNNASTYMCILDEEDYSGFSVDATKRVLRIPEGWTPTPIRDRKVLFIQVDHPLGKKITKAL